MNKKVQQAILLASLFGTVFAASGNDKPQWILAETGSPSVPISLRQKADAVILPITLSCDQNNPAQRIEQLKKSVDDLKEEINTAPDISLFSEPLSSSDGSISGVPLLDLEEGKTATAHFYAFTSPNRKSDSLYYCSDTLADFASTLTVQGATSLSLGQIQLGVERPEQYRNQLLQEIMEEATLLRKMSSAGAVLHLSGLEGPVQVRQIDEENVEIFIAYTLSIELFDPKELPGSALDLP